MKSRHVISTKQFFDRPILETLFVLSDQMQEMVRAGRINPSLQGKLMANLFYEPSTRTRFSFEAAMRKLGGSVISSEAAGHFSSAIKGESVEDTVRVTSAYTDVVVLRHPEVGSAEKAAGISSVPVINAGDGEGEHPTQALLDIYTIRKECGRLTDIKIALIGDLLNGRTIHSLLFLLGLYKGVEITLVAPDSLKLPAEYKRYLTKNDITFFESNSLEDINDTYDVLYVTRVQKERFKSAVEYEALKHYFVVDQKILSRLKPEAVIMHPLPRVGEIDPAIDSDPRAAYFRQAENGLYVRMALLQTILLTA